MREDMFKVIVERPRTGGDGGKSVPQKGYSKKWKKHKSNDYEDAPTKESIDSPYKRGYAGKELNEHHLLRAKCKMCKDLRIEGKDCEHSNWIWYEVTLRKYERKKKVAFYGTPATEHVRWVNVDTETKKEIDDIFNRYATDNDLFRYHRKENVYASSKRQLNKRDLKRLAPIIEKLPKMAA
jgi:hypothetical protein